MKVTALVENTTARKELKSKHGLSLYIETGIHKILFDLGPGSLFLENARKLGIDIASVDMAFISHGHSDHGGGLKTFLKANSAARIYIHQLAFQRTFTKAYGLMLPIGLDRKLENEPRIILTDGQKQIDNGLFLFSGTSGKEYRSLSNNSLYIQDRAGRHPDDFKHEQYLVVRENGRNILFSGCAHRGIVNITAEAERLTGMQMDWCVSGFHLYDPVRKISDKEDQIREIAQKCMEKETRFVTCHCTGETGYRILKETMGERLAYIRTGQTIEL